MLTRRLQMEAMSQMEEQPGEPQIFNLIAYLTEDVQRLVEEETNELNAIQQRQKKEAAAKALAQKQQNDQREAAEQGYATTTSSFANEMERREYAKSILAKGAYANTAQNNNNNNKSTSTTKGRKHYDTGISDQSLCADLFS